MTAKGIKRAFLWTIIYIVSAYFFVTFVAPYFGYWNETLEPRRIAEIGWLIVHFSFGFFALFLAPLQFLPSVRIRYPYYHRTAGKIYIIGSIVSSLIVFYLLTNYPFPGSVPSLGLLSCLWLYFTVVAWWLAKKRSFNLHRQFMTRSYICAMSFVYLRIIDKIDHNTGALSFITDENTRITVIDWTWIFPFLITEFFIQWHPSIKKIKPKEIKIPLKF
jgi:uncharacterized membrane protein